MSDAGMDSPCWLLMVDIRAPVDISIARLILPSSICLQILPAIIEPEQPHPLPQVNILF